MAPSSTPGVRLFCSLFIVIGLIVAIIGVWTLIKSLRTEQWPVTDGVILTAEMASHSGNKGKTYSAEITYSYKMAGVAYTGDKVSIGQMSASAEYAREILNRYPVGRKVSVHYAPGDPSEAVLETGIHGGTWILLGVGTSFTLAGLMFLQIQNAATRAQTPGAPASSSVTVQPDGSVALDRPPVLMGVLFLLAGAGLAFIPPDPGKPGWLMYAVGGVFFCGGVMLLLMRLKNKLYSQIGIFLFLVPFLIVFHWISFGAGDRTGTATSSFSVMRFINVRTPFALFTIFLDLVLAAGLIHWLCKRRRD